MAHIWKNVAITLGFNRANIKGIEMSCHYQPEDAILEMFRQWLKGAHSELKPATWSTLIQSLKDVKLTEIAAMLSNLVSFIILGQNISSYLFITFISISESKG